ncbi:hypothetical protein F2Q69_00048513 [Brassica cretica]|uniref:Uncharacterized protein n=1 Tax=Brassica cretica TaxID=69181 RepID=A0A8S9PHN1_BRACR|nr:hypothetical protein F2Q69_00048513 [Brassica cretica]
MHETLLLDPISPLSSTGEGLLVEDPEVEMRFLSRGSEPAWLDSTKNNRRHHRLASSSSSRPHSSSSSPHLSSFSFFFAESLIKTGEAGFERVFDGVAFFGCLRFHVRLRLWPMILSPGLCSAFAQPLVVLVIVR